MWRCSDKMAGWLSESEAEEEKLGSETTAESLWERERKKGLAAVWLPWLSTEVVRITVKPIRM